MEKRLADFLAGDDWRASNTTPILVFRFEGDNLAALERIQNRFRELVASVRPGIKLPF